MGPFPAELRAHIYSIMVVEDESQWAEVGGLKSKGSEHAATVFRELVRVIAYSTHKIGAKVARVHTDMGTEFKGAFEKLCAELGARHTGTGGYRSTSNPLGEQWNRLAQEGLRAVLAACTGGVGYFDELWLLGLVHVVYWLNRNSTPSRESPYKRVWKKEYVMH